MVKYLILEIEVNIYPSLLLLYLFSICFLTGNFRRAVSVCFQAVRFTNPTTVLVASLRARSLEPFVDALAKSTRLDGLQSNIIAISVITSRKWPDTTELEGNLK